MFHATSLFLHAIAALAVVRALRAARVRGAIALTAGLLFAVHPITCEVADWISARPDGLSAALAGVGLAAALGRRPLLAAVLAGLAGSAKEPGLAAVPAVLLVAWTRAPARLAALSTAVGAALVAAYLALRAAAHVPVNAATDALVRPSAWGAVTAQGAPSWAPHPRCCGHCRLTQRFPDIPKAAAAGALLLATAGTAAALIHLARRRDPLPTALLALGLAPLLAAAAYGVALSERYLYLPALALAIAGGLAAEGIARAAGDRLRPKARGVVLGTMAFIAAGALVVDVGRARDWGAPMVLFESAVQADPTNPDAWQYLGAELHRAGDREAARAAFERSAALGSDRAGLWSNLCATRLEAGDLGGARMACDRAAAINPADPRPRYHRALLLAATGLRDEAVRSLADLSHDHPGFRPAAEALARLRASSTGPPASPGLQPAAEQ